MVLLSRRGAPLLRTVGHKQHATDEHHETSVGLQTPPATSSARESLQSLDGSKQSEGEMEEDYMRSPVSSDDEEESKPHARVSDLQRLSTHKTGVTKSKAAPKRKAEDSESDEELFSSLARSSQRFRPGSQAQRPQFRRAVYSSQKSPKTKKAAFKSVKAAPQPQTPLKKQAAFKSAKNADVFEFTAGAEEYAANAELSPSILSSSSRATSPEVIDVTTFKSAAEVDTNMKVQCPVCDKPVNLLLKQEFEDEFSGGQELNARRKQAFCTFHTQHDAQEQWRARKYPAIKWSGLNDRLEKLLPQLRKVVTGEIDSSFRDALQRDVAGRTKRTAKQRAKKRFIDASAGYYGPRGQKLVMDIITSNLSSELREASKQDPLIMAPGTNAGLSGFVQRVLVPEMAVDLIAEDMRVSRDKAMTILAESKELGEILNDEERQLLLDADRSREVD